MSGLYLTVPRIHIYPNYFLILSIKIETFWEINF